MSEIPGTLPLVIGPHRFDLKAKMSARALGMFTTAPDVESDAEVIERLIKRIAEQIPDQKQRAVFVGLWDDPDYGQGLLLDVWNDVTAHYGRRPTNGSSHSSFGFRTHTVTPSSTPTSSSPVALASTPSSTTPDAS